MFEIRTWTGESDATEKSVAGIPYFKLSDYQIEAGKWTGMDLVDADRQLGSTRLQLAFNSPWKWLRRKVNSLQPGITRVRNYFLMKTRKGQRTEGMNPDISDALESVLTMCGGPGRENPG